MQKIQIIGRLGKEATVNEAQNGGKFLSFRIASNHRRKGVETTSWFDVLAFNYESRFKNMAPYLKKGSMVFVCGEFDDEIEEYNGEHRIRRTIVADSIDFVSTGNSENSKKEEDAPSKAKTTPAPEEDDEPVVTTTKRTKKSAPVKENAPEPEPEDNGDADGEDDLPF